MAKFWTHSAAADAARAGPVGGSQARRYYYGAELLLGEADNATNGGISPPRRLRDDVTGIQELMSPASVSIGARRHHLWFGGGGVTKQAHYDQTHNLYTQLVGSKRVVLSAPTVASRQIHLFPRLHACHRHSMVELGPGAEPQPEKGWTHAFSAREMSDVPAMEVLLQPGETLYIPPFWLHRMESQGDAAVAVSSWWHDPPPAGHSGETDMHPEVAAAGSLVAALRKHSLPMAADRHFEDPNREGGAPCWPAASRCPSAFELGPGAEQSSVMGTGTRVDEYVRPSHKGWALKTVVAVLAAHLEQAPGREAVQRLLTQRYAPLYGPRAPDESFAAMCRGAATYLRKLPMTERERSAMENPGRAKRLLLDQHRGRGSAGIRELMEQDETELLIQSEVGKDNVHSFLTGCFS